MDDMTSFGRMFVPGGTSAQARGSCGRSRLLSRYNLMSHMAHSLPSNRCAYYSRPIARSFSSHRRGMITLTVVRSHLLWLVTFLLIGYLQVRHGESTGKSFLMARASSDRHSDNLKACWAGWADAPLSVHVASSNGSRMLVSSIRRS